MHLIDTNQKLQEATDHILKSKRMFFDIETTGLAFTDDILSLQIKTDTDSYYIPFDTIKLHRAKTRETLYQVDIFDNLEDVDHGYLNFDENKDLLKRIMGSDIPKVAHNFQFDASFFIYRGIDVNNWYFDTMLAKWVLKEDMKNYSLKHLYTLETGKKARTFKEVCGDKDYWMLKNSEMIAYAMDDCDYTEALWERYQAEIFFNFEEFYKTQMMQVAEVLCYMRLKGVLPDVAYGVKFTQEKTKLIEAKHQEIKDYLKQGGFDPELNINSGKDVKEFFYDVLKYTHKSNSVDKEALGKWEADGSKIAKLLLEYRKLVSLLKFIAPSKSGSVLANINSHTGRVHPSWNQHRTVMHRLSSSNPNLQNPPREGGIREIFIAPEGKLLLTADYSQVEYRCMGFYSRDPEFLKAYASDSPIDLHEMTRKNVIEPLFGHLNATEQRSLAKNINFGIAFGSTAGGIARQLGCSYQEAEKILQNTYDFYSVYTEWTKKVHRWVYKHKYVGNVYGFKRRFDHVDFRNCTEGQRAFYYRQAVHSIVSSTAACIIKAKMWNIYKRLELAKRDDIKMMLQIHDELIFEVNEGFNAQEIVSIMEEPEERFDIPLVVDYEFKKRWSK